MARLQALTQQHALERSFAPASSSMIGGMSGASEEVPRMHSLGSSGPIFKAGNLIHLLRTKGFSPHLGSKIGGSLGMHGMPRLKLNTAPRFHL